VSSKRRPAGSRRPAPTSGGNRPVAASPGINWPWWVVGAAVVLAGVLAVVLSAGGGSSSSSGKSGGGTTTGVVEIAPAVTVTGTPLPALPDSTKDPAVGKTAPTLTGVSFNRTPVTIGNTGRAHVVVMVAHWCPHCQAEVPRIVALYKAGQIPVPIVSVATGTDSSAPNYPPSAWLAREGWPYPVLVDTKTETAATAYGLPGYPFLVFVDAQGKVVGRLSGEVAASDLQKLFAELAAGKPLTIPGAGASSSGK
jgi:cytochrome c biogenesis protein CcmG, thiol:disulfide interchange protein DsbE